MTQQNARKPSRFKGLLFKGRNPPSTNTGSSQSKMIGKAMKSACTAVTMTIFALVCCRPAEGRAPSKTALDRQEHAAALEKTIPALMETAGIPGTSIALIRDGEVVWSRGFGIKNKKIGVVYLTNSQNGLSIGQEILDLAIGGGEDLGLAHLNYERHDTPAMTLARTVRTRGSMRPFAFSGNLQGKDPAVFKERDLNGLGYALMNGGRTREAVEILKLNAEAFPDSANVYDSLAEATMKSGDDGQAILLYKKAIEAAARDQRRTRPSWSAWSRGPGKKWRSSRRE